MTGELFLIKCLLDVGADPNLRGEFQPHTHLHILASCISHDATEAVCMVWYGMAWYGLEFSVIKILT